MLTLIAAAPAGAQWSSATTVSPPDQYAQTPVVADDGQGDAAIVWSNRIDSYDSSIEVSVRQGYGPFSAAQMISDGQPGQNTEPSVSVGPDGTVAVLWTQGTQSGDLIRISFGSTSGGPFTAPATLEGPEPYQTTHDPQVSISSGGAVFAGLGAGRRLDPLRQPGARWVELRIDRNAGEPRRLPDVRPGVRDRPQRRRRRDLG